MNARTPLHHLTPAVALLFSGWQHTDTLQFDLYGTKADEDDGYTVEKVTLVGHRENLVELLTKAQLEHMGTWLTYKDSPNPTLRAAALQAKHDAVQGPYEKTRGLY